MPINFAHNHKIQKVVTEFLDKNSLPSAGTDSAVFFSTSEYHVKMAAGPHAEIKSRKTPFGVLYTADYDHIKEREAKRLRRDFNIKIASPLGTPDKTVFIGASRWYKVSTVNGLELVETILKK